MTLILRTDRKVTQTVQSTYFTMLIIFAHLEELVSGGGVKGFSIWRPQTGVKSGFNQ